jgi:hypothetical protein
MKHEHTEHVAAPRDAVYAAISDVGNLPSFVPQITVARPAADGGVEVELFLDTPHAAASDHDVAATLDAIRMLVESRV